MVPVVVSSRERFEWLLIATICVVAPVVGYLAAGGRGAIVATAGAFFGVWLLPIVLESPILRALAPRLPRSPWADR